MKAGWYRKSEATVGEACELVGKIINHGNTQMLVTHFNGVNGGACRIYLCGASPDLVALLPGGGSRVVQVIAYGPSFSDLTQQGWVAED